MTTTTSPVTCKARSDNHGRSYPCNRRVAKGATDGLCGYHRKMLAPPSPTYTCTACWRIVRRGVDSPLCVEHTNQPKDPRYV